MFRLKVVQAFHGDCLIVVYGSEDEPRYMLVDGGPSGTYEKHLKGELTAIKAAGGQLDLIVLSHVDDDHVNGLLDMMEELIEQRGSGLPETIAAAGLWHNSFADTLGPAAEATLTEGMETSALPFGAMPAAEFTALSIRQGSSLTDDAHDLLIPINNAFSETEDGLVTADNVDEPLTLDNIEVQIVGPTRIALEELREDWEEWLEKQKKAEAALADSAPGTLADMDGAALDLDDSVPNLSSIMLLIASGGKRLLLTGDGLGDHLLAGLADAGLLDAQGAIHVDIFKLPHHGSERNVTAELFEKITAETYLFCADGKHDNPDIQTLEWLVEAAVKQGRSFNIVATNDTDGLQQMLAAFPPQENGYELLILEEGADSLTLELLGVD